MKKPSKKELPKTRLPNKDNRQQYQKPIKQIKKTRYSELVGLAIIILLGIIIYSNSFDCSFHLDDLGRIVNNTRIRNLADVKGWSNIYPSRPFGMFTFALNYHFNQLDVQYYHLVNLIIHLINVFLVWWLTFLIFSSSAMKDQPIARNKKVLAFLTALLFVSHPLATQSVTYIIQRLASMAAMFYLLSLALYVKARLANNRNISTYLLFTASLISAVLAMLTKENAFSLPFAIMLFELFFIRTKKLSINFRDYRVILLIAAFLSLLIILLFKFSLSIFKPIPPTIYGNSCTITPLNYFFTQFSVIVKYIQLLFLPINQNLDYDFPISNSFFEIRTLLCFMLLISLIIMAVLSFKRYRVISFGIFWFFITLSIESSFIPISDVIFEHRTYLPSLGFFLIITSGIYFLLWNKHKYLAISIFVIIIGLNSKLTYERNKVWKDEQTLWSDVISKSPNKVRPIFNLGSSYSKIGQYDMAIPYFTKVIEINPKQVLCYSYRGFAYFKLGQWDNAIADFSKVIEITPNQLKVYLDQGVSYYNLGLWDKAIADFSKMLDINPKSKEAYYNRGIAYGTIGQIDKSIADYSNAIEIDPKYIDPYLNLSVLYFEQKNFDAAIDITKKGIEQDPKDAGLYDNLAYYYMEKGDNENAVSNFNKCLEIDNKNIDATLGLAIAYYNKGDKTNAKLYLDKAKQLEPRLAKGMDGIAELEKSGYSYSDKKKETLKKMFEELK